MAGKSDMPTAGQPTAVKYERIPYLVLFNEKLGKEQKIRLVTTLRQDALKGLISKESPVGKALMGRKAGDRVLIKVNPEIEYYVVIKSIEKGTDDESLDISSY